MKPRFRIEQKITAFVNQYKLFAANEAGQNANLIGFAQQKRLAFKEKVTFYTDEQKNHVSFTFRAEKVLDVHGRYFVEDQDGQLVGMFKKQFGSSLVVSTWRLLNANGDEILEVKESNAALAVIRRYGGWIPIIGDIIELVTLFLRYHFVFIDIASGQEVGKYQKDTLFRDHYTLHFTDEALAKLDQRTFLAMGVALDALQSR